MSEKERENKSEENRAYQSLNGLGKARWVLHNAFRRQQPATITAKELCSVHCVTPAY